MAATNDGGSQVTITGGAQDATLTSGMQKTIARGGAKGSTAAADVTSTAVDANTQAMDVSIKGTVPVSVPGVIPVSDNNGSLTVDGAVSVVGTVPVSGTVGVSGTVAVSAAALPLPAGAAQDSTLTGGTQKAINRGAAKGSTVAGDVTSTPVDVNTQALDVSVKGTVPVSLSSPLPITDNGGSLTVDGTVGISGTVPVSGTVGISGTVPVSGTVGISGTVPVSAAALPLPSGAAQDTTLTAGAQKAIARGGAKGATVAADVTSTSLDANTQALDVSVKGTVPVSGTVAVSGTTTVAGTVAVSGTTTVAGTVGISGTVPVSVASPLPVTDNGGSLTVDGTVGISGTVPVSIAAALPVTDNGGSLTVDGSVSVIGTVPVSGTVGISGTTTVAGTVAISGTVPVSAAALPLPTGAAQEHVTAVSPSASRLSDGTTFYDAAKTGQLPAALVGGRLDDNIGSWLGSVAPIIGQKAGVSSIPVVLASDQGSIGKTSVLKTGTLATTAVTADQVVLTYTVTAGKTLYLEYVTLAASRTVISATAAVLGLISVETPTGTKFFTARFTNPTTSKTTTIVVPIGEPVPIAAGVVIRVVCTPADVTSTTWIANFGGYER